MATSAYTISMKRTAPGGGVQGSQGAVSKKEELFYRQSQGRAHLFMDMRIVNDQGQELPWDGKAAGELQVRGPHVLKAYFRVGRKLN